MDEIAQRLKTASESCIQCYEAWEGKKKDTAVREALLEAVHDLRKVAARLEIEIAVSERDERASKPLPIPPHRSSQKRPQNNDDDGVQPQNNSGNHGEEGGNGGGNRTKVQRRRRTPKTGE